MERGRDGDRTSGEIHVAGGLRCDRPYGEQLPQLRISRSAQKMDPGTRGTYGRACNAEYVRSVAPCRAHTALSQDQAIRYTPHSLSPCNRRMQLKGK